MLDLKDPRDFTDSMLIEISKTTDKSSSFYGESGIENLRNTLFDLFLAGSETWIIQFGFCQVAFNLSLVVAHSHPKFKTSSFKVE